MERIELCTNCRGIGNKNNNEEELEETCEDCGGTGRVIKFEWTAVVPYGSSAAYNLKRAYLDNFIKKISKMPISEKIV